MWGLLQNVLPIKSLKMIHHGNGLGKFSLSESNRKSHVFGVLVYFTEKTCENAFISFTPQFGEINLNRVLN